MANARPALIALTCVLFVGCSTTSRHVTSEIVLPDAAERIVVESNQRFLFPGELGVLASPRFPVSSSANDAVDVTVCISFTVDDGGGTRDIRVEDVPDVECARPSDYPEFVASTIEAVDRWEFVAAALCEYATAADRALDDPECDKALSVVAIPVRLAWTFRFTARGGRQTVESRR